MNHSSGAQRVALLIAATMTVAGGAMSGAILPPMQSPSPALLKMAETERAFARRARESTIRQAFIDFFADESIGFDPDPVPQRDALRKRDQPQPPGLELHWEPRLGDVAASGDLGYLTGPAEYVMPGKPNSYTCYFSVWKRQPDGEYRVILDVGVPTPEKTSFPPGLSRSAAVATWKGHETREQAEASLKAADTAFGAALASKGAAETFRAVMHDAGRLNRRGAQPMPKDEAVAWLSREVTEMTSEPMKVEAAQSGDLGYTWGRYSAKGPKGAVSSYYVRVWTRKADGSWQLVNDVTTPPAPPSR